MGGWAGKPDSRPSPGGKAHIDDQGFKAALPLPRRERSTPPAKALSPRLPAAAETVEAGGSLGSSQHLKSSFKLLARPLKPFAKHFALGFLNPGEMLSEYFQLIYAQLIKMPFYKSCVDSKKTWEAFPSGISV